MSSPSTTVLMAPLSPVTVQRSPWHSPVPYLFGGLASMMGLIFFALLILACSYWKLSRRLHNQPDADGDIEAGTGDNKPDNYKIPTVWEKMCVVIMAGEEEPTFLATPSSSRTSSFGSSSCRSGSTSMTSAEESSASEMENDESSDQVQVSTMRSHVSFEHAS